MKYCLKQNVTEIHSFKNVFTVYCEMATACLETLRFSNSSRKTSYLKMTNYKIYDEE